LIKRDRLKVNYTHIFLITKYKCKISLTLSDDATKFFALNKKMVDVILTNDYDRGLFFSISVLFQRQSTIPKSSSCKRSTALYQFYEQYFNMVLHML